jgi:predicted transglutaminase-like cysteine proteinase
VFNTAIIRAVALAAFCSSSALVAAHQNPFALLPPTNQMDRLQLWQAANLVQKFDEGSSIYADFLATSGNIVLGADARSPTLPSEALSLPEFASATQVVPMKFPDAYDRDIFASQKTDVQSRWTDLWKRVLADSNAMSICSVRNDLCSKAERRFLSIVETGRKVDGRARLGWVNRAVNLIIRPMSDWAQYGYAQYWASPLQTLGSGAGDCKDYAIVKFAILRQLGIDQDDLRLVIVYDSSRQTEHEVVAVRHEQQWLILDNLTMSVLDARQIGRYYPLFVLDYRGARDFAPTVAQR